MKGRFLEDRGWIFGPYPELDHQKIRLNWCNSDSHRFLRFRWMLDRTKEGLEECGEYLDLGTGTFGTNYE